MRKKIKSTFTKKISKIFRKKTENNILNLIFLFLCFSYLIFGCLLTFNGGNIYNYYENRIANQLPKFSVNKILTKEYQDMFEAAFSDQVQNSTTMKKKYNFYKRSTVKKLYKTVFRKVCDKNYNNLGDGVLLFGCDNNIVYEYTNFKDVKEKLDNRINNINNVINKVDIPVYIYYIEKDTDINFETNDKMDIYNHLKENIKSENVYNYEINNFDEFKKYFYKTDHHWNYKGSYIAYSELVDIFKLKNKIIPKETKCITEKFSGSKAKLSGAYNVYNEDFCFYTFDIPSYRTVVNGVEGDYGKYNYYLNNLNKEVNYSLFYGFDNGEIIIDNGDSEKDNILIIGESYDNALLNLLASHFNRTYSIDLRNYKRENNKSFDFLNYVKDNKIDKILLIGNVDYFVLKDFNLEV